MDYLKLFDQLYSECESIPDFPKEKAEKLWKVDKLNFNMFLSPEEIKKIILKKWGCQSIILQK